MLKQKFYILSFEPSLFLLLAFLLIFLLLSVDILYIHPFHFFDNIEPHLYDLELQKEMVDLVYEIIENLEKDLASSPIDESSFDEAIAAASEKYCVDFAGLDRGYTFKMEGDNNAQDTSSS